MAIVEKNSPNITVDANLKIKVENQRINILDEAVNKQTKKFYYFGIQRFYFICPTELHAFQAALEEFKNRNTIVIGFLWY